MQQGSLHRLLAELRHEQLQRLEYGPCFLDDSLRVWGYAALVQLLAKADQSVVGEGRVCLLGDAWDS